MFLHLEDAVRQGHTKVSIRTVHTDVVVLAIASVQHLNLAELWVAFGVGKNFRFLLLMKLPRHLVLIGVLHCQCSMLSLDVTRYLSLEAKAKRLHWTPGRCTKLLLLQPSVNWYRPAPQTIEEWLGPLERFVVLLYDRTSSLDCVNEARTQLFTQKGRTQSKVYHLHRLHLSSTSRGLLTKLVIAGLR